MGKAKTGLAATNSIDLHKPLVKDYVDPDLALDEFMQLHLPHVPYSIPQCKLVSKSSDGKIKRYRINWWREEYDGGFVPTIKLTHSATFEVTETFGAYALKEI